VETLYLGISKYSKCLGGVVLLDER